jgi:hypothetical protein
MRTFVAALAVLLLASPARTQEKAVPQAETRGQDPQLLSFDDLVTLSSTARPEGALQDRFAKLLDTPFVRNDASAAGEEPHRPGTESSGPILRVGLWNIERGMNFDLIRAALTDTSEFEWLGRRAAGDHRIAANDAAECRCPRAQRG